MPESLNARQPDPDARLVLDIIDAFRASKAVFTAVSMGLFDRLRILDKPAHTGGIALASALRMPG